VPYWRGGVVHNPGDTLELSAAEARKLQDLAVVEIIRSNSVAKTSTTQPEVLKPKPPTPRATRPRKGSPAAEGTRRGRA
jgi:hypothetical protein